MELCCLLLLCCDPLQRRAKLLEYYNAQGVDLSQAVRLSDDLIAVFDQLLATPLGKLRD